MSFFQKQTFIAIDLETTGVNPDKDKIIEFAGILVENGKITKQLEFLINPEIEISPQIQAITGISNAEVQDKPTFEKIQSEIQDFVQNHVIVGHNIQFDINFLEKNGIRTSQKSLDTYTLSSLFFSEEKSLALEVLSESLQIEHKYKHRALGDILATFELLKIIHQKIRQLSPEILEKIQTFLQNYSTPLKTFFNDVLPEKQTKQEKNETIFPSEENFIQTNKNQDLLKQILNETGKTLLEIPQQYQSILDLLKIGEEKHTLAFYSPKLLNKVSKALSTFQKTPHLVLKNKHNYLCLPKFEKFLQKQKLTESELTLAIKILIWLEETQNGDRDEIALTYDDYTIWYNELCSDESCSGNEHQNCFWHQKIKSAPNQHILTYQNLLLEKNLPQQKNLIICEARDLEKSLTNFASQSVKLENFLNLFEQIKNTTNFLNQQNKIQTLQQNLQILWGYLHRELTKDLETFIYPQKIIFNNTLKTQAGFLKLKQDFANFYKELDDFLKQIKGSETHKFQLNALRNLKTDLQTFFEEWHDNEIRFFHAFPSGELNLQINPIELKNFTIEVLEKYQKILCLDENLGTLNAKNLYTFDYWKNSLGVQENLWNEHCVKKTPENKGKIDLDFLLKKPTRQNLFERTCELIEKTVLKNKGKTIVLFTSYANINSYFGALGVKLQNLGYKVLPQSGGGVKKIKAIFEKFPEKSMIFGIERSFHREFFDVKNVKTLILNKLVFDFPGDPLIQARQEKYSNGFMEFSLPRSIISFKQNYLKLQNESQEFIPLDSRLSEKKYGQYFLKSIE